MRLSVPDRTEAVHGILRCCGLSTVLFPVRYSRDHSVRQVSALLLCVINDLDMETVDIPIPTNHSPTTLPALIERTVSDAGLLADPGSCAVTLVLRTGIFGDQARKARWS